MPVTKPTGQLRYYIAPAAPPTRHPASGCEPFLRPEVGFNPSWFHERCGIDFLEPWHRDPELRMRAWERMTAELRRCFPGRNVGNSEQGGPPDLLTGAFGAALPALLFGQEVHWYADKWPAPHGRALSEEEVDALEAPELESHPLIEQLLGQCDRIEALTGSIVGFINWQGVLNTSFRLRGQEIFSDLVLAPERARHLFGVVADTMIAGMRLLYARQAEAGVHYDFANTGNCVVNMVSGEQYAEQILPFDLRLREAFGDMALHNCAWCVDAYLEAYARIARLGYLDMGLHSDLRRARELFPETRRNLLYTSMDLKNKSEAQIRADFERIARELAPCDLGLPDIEADVPEERILFALDLCAELTDRAGEFAPEDAPRASVAVAH